VYFEIMKRIIAAALSVLLLSGCVTPKIDWTARVGNYTYDQAVTEFGPPDKSAKLTDGSTVAEWLTRRGQVLVTSQPYVAPPGGYFFGPPPMYSQTYLPPVFMRLIFDANGKLKAEKKFTK
jgi:Prokaryotic membrane lipoprotein lipid attachment site